METAILASSCSFVVHVVALGKLPGHAQGASPRDDRHLVDGIGLGDEPGDHGVARLVDGGGTGRFPS
jgi:hypothetical protein